MNTNTNSKRIAAFALALVTSSTAFAGGDVQSTRPAVRTWGFIAEVVGQTYTPMIRFVPAVFEPPMPSVPICMVVGGCDPRVVRPHRPKSGTFQFEAPVIGTLPEESPKQRTQPSDRGR